jgi:hypothetical protein
VVCNYPRSQQTMATTYNFLPNLNVFFPSHQLTMRVLLLALVLLVACNCSIVAPSPPSIDGVWNYAFFDTNPDEQCLATFHFEKNAVLVILGGPSLGCFSYRGVYAGTVAFYTNDSALLFMSSVDGVLNFNQPIYEFITRNGTGSKIVFLDVSPNSLTFALNDKVRTVTRANVDPLLDGVYDVNVLELPGATNVLGRYRWKRLGNPGLAWYVCSS